MSTKADKTGKKITEHVPPRQMIYQEKNRVEPRETLRKITGKIQEPPKSTLSRQTTP
jgi:hypothetical protein